jgi:hypothetical protein
MPAADVLDWARRKGSSGIVTFDCRNATKTLAFDRGSILWASSNRREEHLGAILRRSCGVQERALADSLETRAETGVPLGKVLVMSGVVEEVTLLEVLATKIREAVTDVVTWSDGTFELTPRQHQQHAGVAANVTIDIALTVAGRRADRLTQAMQLLGGDDAVFFVPPSAAPPVNHNPLVNTLAIWQFAGDNLTCAEIVASMMGERYVCADELATLVTAGHLTIDRRHRVRTHCGQELAAAARARLRQGDKVGAFDLARQAIKNDTIDFEVHRTFAMVERAHIASIARTLLQRRHVPMRTNASISTELSTLQSELLAKVDGYWDLLSILRSSNARETEAIMAFDKLRELQLIELS